MKSLIIGNGQIGSALFEIFSKVHETHVRDFEASNLDGIEILHICYPYSDKFIESTKNYIDQYRPRLTIIHSSVAIGTTDKCGDHVVHAPERGRFPKLAKQMSYFKKFIGGSNQEDCNLAAKYFDICNWNTHIVLDPKITEALKLISNAHMGLEIAWRQEIDRWGIDRQIYALWEDSYFGGYMRFGEYNLLRSRMNPDPIGGHCILPCVDILSQTYESPALKFIKESNNVMAERQTKEKISGNGSFRATADHR
jgi:hypothetical protein